MAVREDVLNYAERLPKILLAKAQLDKGKGTTLAALQKHARGTYTVFYGTPYDRLCQESKNKINEVVEEVYYELEESRRLR